MEYLQRSLYALMALKRYPKLQSVDTEMWFFDRTAEDKNVFSNTFTRKRERQLEGLWNRRAKKMLDEREFPAKPSALCRWCSFYLDQCMEGR
jgi:hypothetical protein